MIETKPAIANSHRVTFSNIIDRARTNWKERKVELMGATISALTLIDTIAAASALGGPVILIAALALATLFALVVFLQTLFSLPKNVVEIPPAHEQKSKILTAL